MGWSFEIDNQDYWAYWEKLFTPQECQKIIDMSLKLGLKDAEILLSPLPDGSIPQGVDSNYRDSQIAWLRSTDPEYSWIYERITYAVTNLNSRFFNFDLDGFVEDLQFTEYSAPNGKFDAHVDKGPAKAVRKLSITLQLTDPKKYKGGDLQIMYREDPIIASKEIGHLTVFPSFTLHRVTPVTKGKRHVLVGWVNGKPFR
jgi:PKHD-type hydroxylase